MFRGPSHRGLVPLSRSRNKDLFIYLFDLVKKTTLKTVIINNITQLTKYTILIDGGAEGGGGGFEGGPGPSQLRPDEDP